MSRWNSYRIAKFAEPLELQTEETPQPKGAEVLVRITGCGVCHTDLHIWDGYFDLGGGRKEPVGDNVLPLTPGHEIVGEVEAVGPAAKGVKVGDKRVVYPWIGCGKPDCPECSRGDEHMCQERALGVRVNGGYSDHVLVPDARYLVAYDGLPTALAATYACSGLTAFDALKKVGPLGPNDKLMIIGAGGVGMASVRLAKTVTGVAPIVADIDPGKRHAALENGAAAVIDPGAPGAAEEFVKASGGVAAAVDFVGSEATVRFGTAVLRKSGKLVIVGLFGGELRMPIPFFPYFGITVVGSQVGSLEDLKGLIALGQKGVIGPIPVATRPLAEANQTLKDLKAGKIVGRVVLTP